MAMANNKKQCFVYLTKHLQSLNEDFHMIINDYDQFRDEINQKQPVSSSMKQIDQWEKKSIELIQQTAQQYRNILIEKEREEE
ncbi:unnamed protein product, partial [Adineta ricciae]